MNTTNISSTSMSRSIWQAHAMTNQGDDHDSSTGADQPPVPPLASGDDDITLPGGQSDPTLAGPAGSDATLVQPVTPATATGTGAGGGAAIPPSGGEPPMGGGPDDRGSGRPSWLIPAAGGLVAGLVVALGALALFGGDDADAPVATGFTTTIAPETTIEPAAETTIEPAADTTVESVADTVATPETTVAPETTAAPDTTTAPETTVAPAPPTTLSPNGIPVATEGFVRILDQEYPILRVCQSNPMAGFSVTSYAYEEVDGFIDYVERYNDEGSQGGGFGGDGYEIEEFGEFGEEGFGMIVFQGDGGFPVSVNPVFDAEPDQCGSVTATDPTNPEFPITHSIVDVCLGTVYTPVQQDDGSFDVAEAYGYKANTAEYGTFTALPLANGEMFAVDYTAPNSSFGGYDDAATSVTGGDRMVISANVVGNDGGAYAGQSRQLEVTILDGEVRTCPEV
jgi:hypothetical protein